VFAYTNKDVDALNAELREVRRERGELSGPEVALETKHGVATFVVGDRVQFTDTDKRAGIYNGNTGTIAAIDERGGQLQAVLDAPAGSKGREVSWSASEFAGFRHGYAGTICKGQGKTLDHTYLYHTHHWHQAASYVALTRISQKGRCIGRLDLRKSCWMNGLSQLHGEARCRQSGRCPGRC
jgi:ATP-dependent exoDNAse (exonuclease V) alpha subunit